jgi:membrane fusion protein, multidrug efflux system
MRKSLFAVCVLAVVAGGGAYMQQTGRLDGMWTAVRDRISPEAAGQKPEQPRRKQDNKNSSPVEVASAAVKTLSDDITAVGTLQSDESVQIAAETDGRIAAIEFREGDTVIAGRTLFRLDDIIISAQLDDAKARLTLAEANFERASKLRKSGNTAQSTLDAAQMELTVARSALELLESMHLKRSIAAPFQGVLGFRQVSLGAYVTAGTALVNLEKIDRLKVTFSVPEIYLERLKEGQKVQVIADAMPGQVFEGTIYAIDPAIDINGRAIKIKALLDNSQAKLRPGLLARVTVKGLPREAVTIPESALVPKGDVFLVYRADKGKAIETKVETGRRESGLVEIVKGVQEGEQVVTAGQGRLRDGADVEIVPTTQAAIEG